MSATLQRSWLQKIPETEGLAAELPQSTISAPYRTGRLWDDVQKPLIVESVRDANAIAKLATQAHLKAGDERKDPTLVVVNTVDAAVEVYRSLKRGQRLSSADLGLVHSRFRPHERHELVSTLGLFFVLIRHLPNHPALLGPWTELLEAIDVGHSEGVQAATEPNSLEREVLALSAEDFDLLAYLVCSHHGKVRVTWHASPSDQEAADQVLRIRGVREGDILPPVLLATEDGRFEQLPASVLTLAPAGIGLSPVTGQAGTERVLRLMARWSSFQLAYLEALLRVADQRASRRPVADPLIGSDTSLHGLESGNPNLAGTARGGEGAAALGTDPAQRGSEHGVRGGAGGSSSAGAGTRPPIAATRFVETTRGLLSHTELAPLLAQRVSELEYQVPSTNLEGQVAAELAVRGFRESVSVRRLDPHTDDDLVRKSRHFIRQRGRQSSARGTHPPPPIDCGFMLELEFAEAVPGPIALG